MEIKFREAGPQKFTPVYVRPREYFQGGKFFPEVKNLKDEPKRLSKWTLNQRKDPQNTPLLIHGQEPLYRAAVSIFSGMASYS